MITIGIDLDNTFWNLGETALNVLNNMYDTTMEFDFLYSYDVSQAHPMFRQEDMDLIYLEAAKFCEPYEDAVDVINCLNNMNNVKTFFVTSSTQEELEIKSKRLKSYFSNFKYEDLIMMKHKELLNIDYMIDDLYRNLCNPHLQHGFLYCQPYNYDSIPITNDKVSLVYDWIDIKNSLFQLLQ